MTYIPDPNSIRKLIEKFTPPSWTFLAVFAWFVIDEITMTDEKRMLREKKRKRVERLTILLLVVLAVFIFYLKYEAIVNYIFEPKN